MALANCPECSKEVSTDALRCPHCGKKLRMGFFTKLVLWVGGLFLLLLAYGYSIPENVAKANSARRFCEEQLMPKGLAVQFDCDKAYEETKAGLR